MLLHGKSDRLEQFPVDLWFYEAEQVIAFLREKQYAGVDIIGSSGGALVAINVALEAPELVGRVIADSFEGETSLKAFTENVVEDRECSKHDKTIGIFFHKPISGLKPEILLTGSREDEFIASMEPGYFDRVYGEMLKKIGHGSMYLFETGGHPALLSSDDEFLKISKNF